MSNGVVILTTHPSDPDILVLRPGRDQGTELMDGFGPATYSTTHRGWLIEKPALEAFKRWLRITNVRLVDDRPKPGDRSTYTRPTLPDDHECNQTCRDQAVPFGDWAAHNPDLAKVMLDGMKKLSTDGESAVVQALVAVVRASAK